jgi:hypothetical protein
VTFWQIIAVLVIAMIAPPAFAAVDLDQKTKDYLEGDWLIDKVPDKGPCVSADYSRYQYEFEFRKSGGRVQLYEPYDLFTALSITDASRDRDDVTMTWAIRELRGEGWLVKLSSVLRILSPDRMELRLTSANDGPAKSSPQLPEILYRCAVPDHTVNDSVNLDQLSVLTSPDPEKVLFEEAHAGLTDEQNCSRARNMPGMLGLDFEVFGPNYYYIFGSIGERAWHSKLDLEPIRSVTSVDNKTLRLEILERMPGGTGWSDAEHVRPYILNVVWDGHHIFVPEMNRTFVRCKFEIGGDFVPAPAP